MEHGLFAAARILTPHAGVSLLRSGGVSTVTGTCGMVFGVVCILWMIFRDSLLVPTSSMTASSLLSIDGNANSTEKKQRVT